MLRRKFDVVTIGGATRDIMFYTSDGVLVPNTQNKLKEKLLGFEYGAKIIPESLHQVLGGGATNAAVSFARLGLRVGAFVRLGRDRDGDAIEAELRKAGVKTRFIERDSSVRTGFSFFAIHSPTKEHVAFLHRGANDNMRMSREELRQARTQWFYVSSLTGDHWEASLKNITAYLSSHPKIKLAWNPGSTQIKAGRGKLSRLLSKTEILILNRDEAIELAGTSAKNSNPRSLVKTLRSWGPKVVVITNGKKGVYAYAGEKVVFHQALVGKQTDTTGAGDAFGSTFVAGYIRSRGELALPLREAAVNSSSVVRQVGAQAGLLRRKALTEEIHKQYPHA